MTVILRPHDPAWAEKFQAEADVLKSIFRIHARLIEHIGSTSIPDIFAKPVIDILIGVEDLEAVDQHNGQMEAQGYEAKGSNGLDGRRYFRKSDEVGIRTHHVHVYQINAPDLSRHLAFRDYLRAHPEKAALYSSLKITLAEQSGMSRKRYQAMKHDCIVQLDCEAQAWLESLKSMPQPSTSLA